jgi:hypothetical protein
MITFEKRDKEQQISSLSRFFHEIFLQRALSKPFKESKRRVVSRRHYQKSLGGEF